MKRIPLHKIGKFNKLYTDYVGEEPFVSSLVDIPLKARDIKDFEKKLAFSPETRKVLVEVLEEQHAHLGLTNKLIASLLNKHTYTVTTGHQLNIFGGPLFVLYKVLSAIKLASELKSRNPNFNFVPVFWLATEDHDFEEIRKVSLFGKTVEVQSGQNGPVGPMSVEMVHEALEQVVEILGDSERALQMATKLKEAYALGTLAQATTRLWYDVLSDFEFVILDACHPRLKEVAADMLREEVLESVASKDILPTIKALEDKSYNVQAVPSDVNMFWMEGSDRLKISAINEGFKVGDKVYSKTEMAERLDKDCSALSPNVITRPVYQEIILPNLTYVGGPGEIAYWLELGRLFEHYNLTMPQLVPRANFGIIDERSFNTMQRVGINYNDLLRDSEEVIREKFVEGEVDISGEINEIKKGLDALNQKIDNCAPGRLQMSKAFEAKTIKELERLEDQVMREAKKRHEKDVKQVRQLYESLFPGNGLQERKASLPEYWIRVGSELPTLIYDAIELNNTQFTMVTTSA